MSFDPDHVAHLQVHRVLSALVGQQAVERTDKAKERGGVQVLQGADLEVELERDRLRHQHLKRMAQAKIGLLCESWHRDARMGHELG